MLLARWLSANGGELRFTAADLALLPAGGVAAPSTAVMFRHTVAGLQLEHVAGISATQLIGRFSLFSPEIHDLCRRLAAAEAAAAPQALFADIGQQSHSHVDNINRRRPIYPYEIPVNVFSQAEESQLLTLSDLRLSVRNGELLLRSVRLGRQVLPRLATAYQYRHNELPLFRFLGDLQLQGMAPVPGLDLARIFPDLDHYPRVCFEGTILSAARWSVSEAELRAAVATPGAMRSFQERKRLPALISLGQQDRQLVVDLEKPEQWSWLLANIKGQGKVVLQEYLAPGTRFAGQYIAFLNATAGTAPATCPALSPRPKATRRFLPGQEWLYLKYYCTPATADRLLHEVIAPVIRSHRRRWSCWFFIRYQDPDHHLRLRVRALGGDPSALLSAFAVRLRKSGLGPLISKVSYDTYERELERYGAGFIYPVEKVFEAGSTLCLRSLALGRNEFTTGIVTALHMLRCFLPGLAEQRQFAEHLVAEQFRSFKGDKALKRSLDLKYRSLRQQLDAGLRAGAPEELAPLVSALVELAAQMAGEAAVVRRRMLADLIHMQLNRSFRQLQLRKELVVYHCLSKYLRSLSGKVKEQA